MMLRKVVSSIHRLGLPRLQRGQGAGRSCMTPVMVQQVRHYDFDSEYEQLKTQQVSDQVIPPAKDSTVYEILNFQVMGHDCTLVEHFTQYAHNLAKNMDLTVFDSYAMPTKETLIHTIQMPGIPEKSKVKDFTLATHERVLQIQDLPSTTAPLFTELLQLNLPEGLQMKVQKHTQEHYKERFIKKEIPESLL
ncbi:large ribosomal subunit protein mL48-like [Diadema antillarum]|uniref:large ribosomal subunit protein mL48-like n=1 Tax=Diadema antillarum TaxID=105358 RepID=UPI003A8A948C